MAPVRSQRDAAPVTPPQESAHVTGFVTDVQGARLSAVEIVLGGKQATTNAKGEFDLGLIAAGEELVLLATRDGYSTGRQRVDLAAGQEQALKVTLQAVETATLEDVAAGGEVSTESGVVLDLPADSVVDAQGNPVSGPIEVTISLLNDRDEIAAAPGGLIAENPDSASSEAETPLESFGMVEVTLRAEDGSEVNLKAGTEAELVFPLAPNHPFAVGETIPLWHFDEQEELWKVVGEGVVQADNTFKAVVEHFSWWNADQVLTRTCIRGRVLDAAGGLVNGAAMTAEGRSYLGSSHATTGTDGAYCIEARVSSVIELSALLRTNGTDQALAVTVNTPRTVASCSELSQCFMIDDLVAVADQPLCDPASCPQADGKQACCMTDLGPCDFVVNGDCGGSEDGSWDTPPEEPGVEPIPGVPMPPPPTDGGTDAAVDQPPADSGTSTGGTGGSDPGTGGTGTGGTSGSDGGTGTGGTSGSDGGTGTGGTSAGTGGADPGTGGAGASDGGTGTGGTSGSDGGASACPSGMVRDCTGGCTEMLLWGNGSCDPPFNCVELLNDNGDCSGPPPPSDGGTGGGGGSAGSGSVPVDRCADVTALSSLADVSGTTAGSTLLNDWYESGACSSFLPGYERVYSVDVPPGATLRAFAAGTGMRTLIAMSCSDVSGSCMSDKPSTATFSNPSPTAQTAIVIVDNVGLDVTGPFTLKLSTAPESCGDGFPDEPESCDDGGTLSGDGCSASCWVEPGWVCPIGASCHQVVCGDGILEGQYESCDDGNTINADGCSSSCAVEPGWVCPQGGTCRQIVCGDGLTDGFTGGPSQPPPPPSDPDAGTSDGGADGGTAALPEQCDDANTSSGDGCDALCQVETGFACSGSPSVCQVRPDGDLCSNPLPLPAAGGSYDFTLYNPDYGFGFGPDVLFVTTVPDGELLRLTGSTTSSTMVAFLPADRCPDFWSGFDLPGGPFDIALDPMQDPMFGVSSGPLIVAFAGDTRLLPSTLTLVSTETFLPSCGDGFVTYSMGEQCDDHGTTAGDGCDASCQVEPGFVCPTQGQACRPIVCGDGMIDWPFETCEDGAALAGDGCGADCNVEDGYLCEPRPLGLCEARPAGDLCSNGDVLPTGLHTQMYSMAGMTSDDLGCIDCPPTRWFSIPQQPGEVTALTITAGFDGAVSLFAPDCPLSGMTAPQPYPGAGGASASFGPSQQGHAHLANTSPSARTLHVQVSSYVMQSGDFTLTVKTGPAGCGDGVVGDPTNTGYPGPDPQDSTNERCDDMNASAGDGCNASCQPEAGFRCPSAGGVCTAVACGDGVVDDEQHNAFYESCDDGNTNAGDGCGSDCVHEAGAACYGEPSVCSFPPPGTLCGNALALPLGSSSHTVTGQGWFTIVLDPRERLTVSGSASFDGMLELLGSDSGQCAPLFNAGSGWFGGTTPVGLSFENRGYEPLTMFLEANAWGGPMPMGGSTSGTLDLDVTVEVPTSYDCMMGTQCPLVCGDGVRAGGEQCDDGNATPGDGCSESCVEEPTHVCVGDTPSVCSAVIAGDLCANALPLFDDVYSFSGFGSEPGVPTAIASATRWFTVDVPAWTALWIDASSSDTSGGMVLHDLGAAACWMTESGWFQLSSSSYGAAQAGRLGWLNGSSLPRTVALVVWDDSPSPSSNTFALTHELAPLGCGDGFVNPWMSDPYGAFEDCDDGNTSAGDGCSPSCSVEPGWDCAGSTCVPVVCGDAIVNGGEGCDDGGLIASDGCAPDCKMEPGYLCWGEPSTCAAYQPADLCDNAEPLVDGSYSLAGYLPDVSCEHLCSGADRWFTVSVPAGQTLYVEASTTNLQGLMRAYDLSMGSCASPMYASGTSFFAPAQSGSIGVLNVQSQTRTYAIAVAENNTIPSGGTFTLAHQITPIGCGDRVLDDWGNYGAPEACDDGNLTDGDGCSSTCAVEGGYVCVGSPSTCLQPLPGDYCENAQPLTDGSFDLSGYYSYDPTCTTCGVDRFFTVTVPAGELLVLDVTTTGTNAYVDLFELTSAGCSDWMMNQVGGSWLDLTQTRRLAYYGPPGGSHDLLVRFRVNEPAPTSVGFTVTHAIALAECGDGYLDQYGQYGPVEQCDDGNLTDGDGCSSACTVEGTGCPLGLVPSCDGLACVDGALLGNGICDPMLSCAVHAFDNGDCSSPP